MSLCLKHINYSQLNARQKENFNFQKLSAVLADYGFVTMRLSDDWQGADFIAQHIDGTTFLKVQLKGRLIFDKKYMNKDLYIAFSYDDDWYLCPHDEVLEVILAQTNVLNTSSWQEGGAYSFPKPSRQQLEIIAPYKLVGNAKPILATPTVV